MSFQAHFGASRLGNCVPITDLVAKCVNVVCLVAVATLRASVSGVSLLRACGSSHNGLIFVSRCLDNLGFVHITTITVTTVLAVGRASGRGHNVPVIIFVAKRVNIIVNVRIATMTSIGGKALVSTSRCGYYGLIFVSDCLGDFGFVCIAAITITTILTISRASRRGHYVPFTVCMAESGDEIIHITISALCTRIRRVSLLCTSRYSYDRFVFMEQRRNHSGFKNDSANRAFLMLAAIRTVIRFFVNDPITRLVACCGNRPILRIVAA